MKYYDSHVVKRAEDLYEKGPARMESHTRFDFGHDGKLTSDSVPSVWLHEPTHKMQLGVWTHRQAVRICLNQALP